ncbi:unnamed protein product [Alopecurus aequalis]
MEHTDDDSRKLARRLTQQITDGLAEHQRVGSGVFGAAYQEHWDSAIDWEPQYEKSEMSKSDRMDEKRMSSNMLDDILLDGNAEPISIPLALLQQITDNFDDSLRIGEGGFAVVYKGVLQSGYVAVKKLLNSQTIEDEPFYIETSFLMTVKHQNIVRFMGYCANTENKAFKVDGKGIRGKFFYPEMRERLLCFEYISNGSLDKHITDELRGLECYTRYEIIKGICEGLEYLHKEKDFGISKQLDGISRFITKRRQGTLGYCAPEYLHRGQVSFKADIFSLGIIITDIMTGRKDDPSIKNILRRWRYRWNKSGTHQPLGCEKVTKCIKIAARCTAHDMKTRPDISDIVTWLNETESMNEHISDAGELSVGQIIRPYSWELLDIDPIELHFPFEINKEISCSLHLTSTKDDYVAFHIELPSTRHYIIEPNRGIVPPQSKTDVMVTLQAQKQVPNDMLGKDEFVLRCTIVNDGLKVENITKDMFDGMLSDVVDKATLTVSF